MFIHHWCNFLIRGCINSPTRPVRPCRILNNSFLNCLKQRILRSPLLTTNPTGRATRELPVKRKYNHLSSHVWSPVTHASVSKLLARESSTLTFYFRVWEKTSHHDNKCVFLTLYLMWFKCDLIFIFLKTEFSVVTATFFRVTRFSVLIYTCLMIL